MTPRSPHQEKRMVPAKDVLAGTWRAQDYPLRHVIVWHPKELVVRAQNPMWDTLLSAVELLESQGWQVVNIALESTCFALLRRPEAPRAAFQPL